MGAKMAKRLFPEEEAPTTNIELTPFSIDHLPSTPPTDSLKEEALLDYEIKKCCTCAKVLEGVSFMTGKRYFLSWEYCSKHSNELDLLRRKELCEKINWLQENWPLRWTDGPYTPLTSADKLEKVWTQRCEDFMSDYNEVREACIEFVNKGDE